MSEVDALVSAYAKFVELPWRSGLPGPQRVWMVVYDPRQERRIRRRLPEFELATRQAGHKWRLLDLTDAFPRWVAAQEYAEEYFKDPDALTIALDDFVSSLVAEIRSFLEESDEETVTTLLGAGALFPHCRVSQVIEAVNSSVAGRLLVFFPGSYLDNVYRLLNARDGWNYMAVPITASL
jgi:hypothetical protein